MKPRPANMFQHPQESAQALRDKLLFVEAMTASGELTLYELRVATLLALSYSTTNGCAIVPMQYIADALGIPKQHVGRTIRSLEGKGWFRVEPGTRGGGKKRNPNRYRPNVSKVPSAVPFYSAALRRAQNEQGTSDPQSKVPEGAAHGTCRGTESGYYVNPVQDLNPADGRHLSAREVPMSFLRMQ